jgi:branched-chain amino acid transport system permease protein
VTVTEVPEPSHRRALNDTIASFQQVFRRVDKFASQDDNKIRAGRYVIWGLLFFLVVQLLFHQSLSNLIEGMAEGSLYGIIGVGLVLIYRTTRVINFATAALGAVPAVVALYLVVLFHVDYLVALPIVLVGGPLFGGLTDIVLMRRFSNAPRLIVTVLTIGVAQTFSLLAFFIPIWMGHNSKEISAVPTPWQNFAIHNGRGQPVITGNQIAAFAVVTVLTIGLMLFLTKTRIGLALRASAENADRASLLGIPVRRIATVAWMLAGLLAALAIFVQAPLIGVPQDASGVFDTTLLYGLAAAIVARFDRMGLSLLAGLAVGILGFASVQISGSTDVGTAVMFVVILIALLSQRARTSRAFDTGVETWRSLKEYHAVPTVLRPLREVRAFQFGVPALLALVAIVVGLPVIGLSNPLIPDLVILPIYGIVAVSLVVLTGWAGQISLGQFGLAAAGALVTGGLVASHNLDFFFVLGLGIAAGVVVAVLVGLPAVRFPGMSLAVITLAFNYAVVNFLMDNHYWPGSLLMPSGLAAAINRPTLWQRVTLGVVGPNRNFYFVCLVCLAASMGAAASFRRLRSGRVLIAVRDNQRAASSYAINVVRSRLAAFAVAGGMAGMAGVLLMYAQGNVIPESFDPTYSIFIFLAVVVGGATSLPWAVFSTISFEATVLFGPKILQHVFSPTVTQTLPYILTGPGLILTLIQYPSGNAEWGYQLRDRYLRWIAQRKNILVPSLVADRRVVVEDEGDKDAISGAEHHYEEVREREIVMAGARAEGARGLGEAPTITCPVCGEVLSVVDAADHDHLRTPPTGGGGMTP